MRLLLRLLPLTSDLSKTRARIARAFGVLLLSSLGLQIAGVLFAPALAAVGMTLALPAGAAMVLSRARFVEGERRGWLMIGAGLVCTLIANVYAVVAFGNPGASPGPSPADAFWLSFYVLGYIGLTYLLRARVRTFHASMWLDGVVGGLCVAAIGAAVVFQRVLETSASEQQELILNLTYPLADLAMLALVVASFALMGWRPGRAWAILGIALATNGVADCAYLLHVADGGSDPTAFAAMGWTVASVLAGFAAWQRPQMNEARTESWTVLVMPALFALMALGLIVYGNLAELGVLALVLAAAAVVAAMVRTGLTFVEVRSLGESRRQALTDELSGLPNRRAFQRELSRLTANALEQDGAYALMLVDLDGFKELNDTLGHHVGDVVLQQLGPRLRRAMRTDDFLARLGGDEFAVLMPGVRDPEAALMIGERMRAALRPPFALAGMSVHVDASAGVAVFPEHGSDGSVLLQRADIAMYQAKAAQSGCEVYAQERDEHSRDRLELMGELRSAIENGRLTVHFQPKASLATGATVGVEALVRWDHPERGLIPPMAFIPLAEQTGLMRALTECVLRTALTANADWRARGHDLTIAVNIAAANLLDAEFTSTVQALLGETGVPPSRLILELTEYSVMADPERGELVLRGLRELGVELSLDDFGTGYSSLAYLSRLPVGELKIDRSFVGDLMTNADHDVIVRALTDLARNLGVRLVAEGIEDRQTWNRLREYGCDEAQGYFLAKPMPGEQLLGWLETDRIDTAAA